MDFPFLPLSTRSLEPGHFWRIALPGGRSCAGVVVGMLLKGGKQHSRIILAGLLDWCGHVRPEVHQLHSAKLIESGAAHVKLFQHFGEPILGKMAPTWEVPCSLELQDYMVARGNIWGYEFISKRAEAVFTGVSSRLSAGAA